MTPRQLEVFICVVKTGSVTEAASQLAMSQPSVSKSLALSEQQLGFSLFRRQQGKMLPTPEARELYKEALRISHEQQRFARLAEHIRHYRVGQLRVAATPALALNVLPQAVARFRDAYPDYGIVADMCLNSEIESAVQEGRYDLGFMVIPDNATSSRYPIICQGEMVCVMQEKHSLAVKPHLCWQDIDTRDLIFITTDTRLVAMVSATIPEFSQRQVAVTETNRYSMAVNMVRSGENNITLVDSFSLKGIDLNGLAVRSFHPALAVSVVTVADEQESSSEPTAHFVSIMDRMLNSL